MTGMKQAYRMGKYSRIILTAAAVLLFIALSFLVDGRHNAAQEYGGEMNMSKKSEAMGGESPLIDRNAPSLTETATFALG